MLFVMIGFIKPKLGPIPQDVQERTNAFLGQGLVGIRSAGPLHDAAGNKVAMMMLVEMDDHAAAERFMRESPYAEAGYYSEVRVLEYRPEVGA